jgi:hypothetical protein
MPAKGNWSSGQAVAVRCPCELMINRLCYALCLFLSVLLWLSSTHPSAAKGPLHHSTIVQTMESTREQAMRQSGMGTSKEVH